MRIGLAVVCVVLGALMALGVLPMTPVTVGVGLGIAGLALLV